MAVNFGKFYEVRFNQEATLQDPLPRRHFTAKGLKLMSADVVGVRVGELDISTEQEAMECTIAVPFCDEQNPGAHDDAIMEIILQPQMWNKVQEGHTRAQELRNVLRNNAGFQMAQDVEVNRVATQASARFGVAINRQIQITDCEPDNLTRIKPAWFDEKCARLAAEVQKLNSQPAFLRREANRLSGTGQLSVVPQTRPGLTLDEELFFICVTNLVAITAYSFHFIV